MEPDKKTLAYLQVEIGSYVGQDKVKQMACKLTLNDSYRTARTGAANHFNNYTDDLQAEIKILQDELADATSKNDTFLKLIQSLGTSQTQTRFHNERRKTQDLTRKIEMKNHEIKELRETVKNLEAEIKHKEAELENVTSRINKLCSKMGIDPSASLKDVEAQLHAMDKRPKSLTRQASLPNVSEYRSDFNMAEVLKDEIRHLYHMKSEHEHRIRSLSLIVRGMEQSVEFGSMEDIVLPNGSSGASAATPNHATSPPSTPIEDDGVFSGGLGANPSSEEKSFNLLGLPPQKESVYCVLCRKSVSRSTRHHCLIHYKPEQNGLRLCCQDDRRGGCIQFPHCYVTPTLQNKMVLTDGTSFVLNPPN